MRRHPSIRTYFVTFDRSGHTNPKPATSTVILFPWKIRVSGCGIIPTRLGEPGLWYNPGKMLLDHGSEPLIRKIQFGHGESASVSNDGRSEQNQSVTSF